MGITPWWNLDPISLPRLSLLAILSSILLPGVFVAVRYKVGLLKFYENQKVVLFTLLIFAVLQITTILFTDKYYLYQFMGEDGRNFGFLAIFSITVTMAWILSQRALDDKTDKSILAGLFFGGIFNLVYGYVQYVGKDPVRWTNPYGPVVGTLGNPNFMSAYLALFVVLVLGIVVLKKDMGISRRLCGVFLFVFAIPIIYFTKSIQGLFIVLVGSLMVVFIVLMQKSSKLLKILFTISALAFIVLIFVGFLGKGTLGSYIYQSTLQVRTYYWHAAWEMMLNKPLTGFGFDSFGTWYTKYRNLNSTLGYGPGLISDSPHNLYLDFGVAGGFPLFLSFIGMQILILIFGIKGLNRCKGSNWTFTISFVIWFCFAIQSLISPANLVIIFTGLLMGANVLRGPKDFDEYPSLLKSKNAPRIFNRSVLASFVVASAIFAILVLKADANFRSALLIGEGNKIIATASSWPQSERRLLITSKIFYANKLSKFGQQMAETVLRKNPNNLEALKLLYEDKSYLGIPRELLAKRILMLDKYRDLP